MTMFKTWKKTSHVGPSLSTSNSTLGIYLTCKPGAKKLLSGQLQQMTTASQELLFFAQHSPFLLIQGSDLILDCLKRSSQSCLHCSHFLLAKPRGHRPNSQLSRTKHRPKLPKTLSWTKHCLYNCTMSFCGDEINSYNRCRWQR